MKDMEPIAHFAEDGRVHLLEEHLRETVRWAGEFTAVFGCGEWGRVRGCGMEERNET